MDEITMQNYAIEQESGKGCFRRETFFPAAERKRKYLCSDMDDFPDGIEVTLSDGGAKLNGFGMSVLTPELLSHSVSGASNLRPYRAEGIRFGEQRLVIWCRNDEGGLVVVRSSLDGVGAALERKRKYQKINHNAGGILPEWITPKRWEEMTRFALTRLAEDETVLKWWDTNARLKVLGKQRTPRRRVDGEKAGRKLHSMVDKLIGTDDLKETYFIEQPLTIITDSRPNLLVKCTPYVGDGEADLPDARFPDYITANNFSNKKLTEIQQLYAGCYLAVSFDGKTFFRATDAEIRKELMTSRNSSTARELLSANSTSEICTDTWRKCINERVRRLEKRRAQTSTTTAQRMGTGTFEGLAKRIRTALAGMIGSIPVFDVECKQHVPAREISRFGPFRMFTATTPDDIDSITKGRKGDFIEAPFPTIVRFEPVAGGPDVRSVEELYHLGLMVARSVSGNLYRARDAVIAKSLKAKGLGDVEVSTFLDEVKDLLQQEEVEQESGSDGSSASLRG